MEQAAENKEMSEDPTTKEAEEENEQITSFINELETRFKQKQEERKCHDVKNIEYPDEGFFAKLDSSIKKNSAFVKKLRNMTEAQRDNIMKDLSNLNLSRYISEVANALVETKIKINEIPLCIKICSFLHLRYQEFATQLMDSWVKNLPRKPTDTFNASKMRIDIRIFSELTLTGIFNTKDSLPVLGNLLTILTNGDKEKHNNLNIILSFCRQYAIEFAGLISRKSSRSAEKFNLEIPKSDFLTSERQRAVRNLLKEYYQSLVAHLQRDHKNLQKMQADMKGNLETKGEVSKKFQEVFEAKQLEFQKLWTLAQQFADLIDEYLPHFEATSSLDDLKSDSTNGTAVIFDINNRFRAENQNQYGSIWEDEETRTFYENLPDLKSIIPAILYKDSLKDTQNKDSCNGPGSSTGDQSKESSNDVNEDTSKELKKIEDLTDEVFSEKDMLKEEDAIEYLKIDDRKTDSDSKVMESKNLFNKATFTVTKDQLDLFFSSLLNCVNRDFIDKAALTFATTFNTKNNRKNLVKSLMTVPRTRLDLLPFYSRFVAQLAPIMPTVASELVSALKGQFRYNFSKKDQVNIESKVKIIRFIGELTKFSIFQKSDVLYILKTLLSDFHHHHIEMTCNLFETCGQYLYHSPDSYHLTKHLLDQMMRLKKRMVLDNRYEIMIENAYYSVNPPEDKLSSRNISKKPVLHQYIEHLIYNSLNMKTVSKVLNKLRKINWKDEELSTFAIKCLSSVWNIKFNNINALACLLSKLCQHQTWAIARVLDNILEDIRLGMQITLSEFNQQRIAVIRYFAECFNFNLIDSTILFSHLYSLLTYGVNYEDILKSELDPPTNLMRLRLVANVLHTCGNFLTSPSPKKKLDYFILYYQRYYWFKKSYLNSLPQDKANINSQMSIDMIFKDVIHYLKPKFRYADSYQSACKQLEKAFKDLSANAKDLFPTANINVNKFLNPRAASPKELQNGLDPIVEEEECGDDQHDGGDAPMEDEEIDNESNGDYEDEDYDCDEEINENNEDEEMTCDRGSESENEDESPMNAPVIVKCEEDDEFLRDFDRMLNDDLVSRSREVVRSNVEIAIPIERDTEKRNKFQPPNSMGPFSLSLEEQSSKQANTFNFRVMTRNQKSSKPVLRSIEVSSDTDLVQNYLAREEKLRAEKEEVKRLILDINQRREMEDSGSSNQYQTNQANLRNNPSSSQSFDYRNMSNSHYRRRYN